MKQLSEHFWDWEFRCPCCGALKYDEKHIAILETVREECGGHPMLVLSGYRCPVHNAEVGGHPESYHLKGKAADIYIPAVHLLLVSAEAINCGEGGVGLYPVRGFVHLDLGPVKYWIDNRTMKERI